MSAADAGGVPSLASSSRPLSDKQFKLVCRILHEHAGIELNDGKRELVSSRLGRRLRATGCGDYGQYIDRHVADGPGKSGEFTHFVDALSTNLTSFGRESQHFVHLRDRVLKPIAAGPAPPVRGWCAACSTGEEAYTLAALLGSCIGPAPQSRLLATDISTRVLATASAGVYPAAEARALPRNLLGKFFEPRRAADGSATVAAGRPLRDIVAFRHLNLMADWPFQGPFDFIFCRNVMIYFDRPTRERLVQRLVGVLAPGGVLYTGHSESLSGGQHGLSVEGPAIYRKAGRAR